MHEKNLKIGYLLDFYGEVLSERKRSVLDMYYNEEDGKWKLSSTDEKFKEVLDFIKIMYDEKLIDPEFITATQAAWTSKITQNDKAFVTWDWIGRLEQFKEQTKTNQ